LRIATLSALLVSVLVIDIGSAAADVVDAETTGFTTVNEATIRYLNRLSDLLFVIARVLARRDGGSEVIWVHGDQRD